MTLYIPTKEVEANLEVKAEAELTHLVLFATASTVASRTAGEIALPMVKNTKSAEKTITLRQSIKVVVILIVETTASQEKRKEKRNFMK